MQELLKFVASSAVLIAVVGWLVRELVKHFLSKDVASYKISLQAESTIAIERLRSELRERELVFKELHEKRAFILSELYGLMVEAIAAVERFVKAMSWPDEEERKREFKAAAERVGDFRASFTKNRIWLGRDLSQQIEHLLQERTEGLLYKFYNALELQARGLGKDWVRDEIVKLWNQVNDEVPVIQESLEREFRNLLGVEARGRSHSVSHDNETGA